jgi:phosphoserine phosphatase
VRNNHGLRTAWLVVFSLLVVLAAACAGPKEPQNPLPSWNDGAARASITSFVERTTTEGSPDFVPVEERIAVFDNDGALWPENPIPFQLAFAVNEVNRMVAEDPALKEDPMVQALLAGDTATLLAGPRHDGLLRIIALTHSGMTTEEFTTRVNNWIGTAKHPKFDRPYDQLTYQPMQEVLRYLRANGFKTFIVSGGGADFMRAWSERVYGIPPEQVVGSSIKTTFEMRDGKPVLVRLRELNFIDDKEGKPIGIKSHIGRRPIAAFGNSDGDLQMLQWTTAGQGPRFALYVHHTDAEREWAYDRNSSIGRLDKGLGEAQAKGWTVVDMKRDWKVIYPPVKQ